MKKYVLILGVLLVSVFIITFAGNNKNKNVSQSSQHSISIATGSKASSKQEANNNASFWEGHEKKSIDCKTCHSCEYPMKGDPCLVPCPKSKMISVHHTPEEGPEIVTLNQIKGNEGYSVFAHKLHAQMAEMSGGCTSCHHYNTTGPVLKCSKCHEANRAREDITKPDLKGAYHRQCMNCHRQWEGKVECENCHIPEGPKGEAKKIELIKTYTGKSHPRVQEPTKIMFETNYQKGKIVSFFHDEHIKKFNLECVNCHRDDNCTKCHSKATAGHLLASNNQPVKIHKSLEEHHQPCGSCHNTKDNCAKCHSETQRTSFDHAVNAGWPLKGRHLTLQCSECHGKTSKFAKLNTDCNSCHKNFVQGKFNHKVTGIVLDNTHKDNDCENCHAGRKFDKKPVCGGCHDDKSYPKQIPGKRVASK